MGYFQSVNAVKMQCVPIAAMAGVPFRALVIGSEIKLKKLRKSISANLMAHGEKWQNKSSWGGLAGSWEG